MLTRAVIRFINAKNCVKELARDYRTVNPGDVFATIFALGTLSGMGIGLVAGLYDVGVALGNGKNKIDHTSMPFRLILSACTGAVGGGSAGLTLGFIAAAPKVTAGVECAVGAVAATTNIKNRLKN